jgi:threonine synthase
MQYVSTSKQSPPVSFREAVLQGQPPDKSLYFPAQIGYLSEDFLSAFHHLSPPEFCFEVIAPYVGDDIPEDVLRRICRETVDFPFPLVPVTDDIYALELFHGATLAFKDVGARFMSRCLQYFARENKQKTVVIVATSGDTGGAVANGFYKVAGVEVVILYPSKKVSRVQELQLTTLGENITALEVDGTFDDCQALAKQALADAELKETAFLTSANSINVARWLPQQFYYFDALQQWHESVPPVISVPSGNFGNICAGLLAQQSGLAVGKFIAACNANDTVPRFLQTGEYAAKPTVATFSNAMDVSSPSNFVRIQEIFGHNAQRINERMPAVSVDDAATAATMQEVYEKYGYILDPHGAVAFRALSDYLGKNKGQKGIFLATAHPVKFDSVKEIIGTFGAVPAAVNNLFSRQSESIKIDNNYIKLKTVLKNICKSKFEI